jgi:carboxymethylenebutenolidase
MPGERVEFASNGKKAQGYLATPASGRGPGVIVIQEWWGLVAHIKAVADRFASAGFVALAPDLYRGEFAERPDDAGRLMMALDIERAVRDLAGAVRYLLARPGVAPKKVGAVGFCMGGQLALAAACASASVGAVVDFYGVHPNVTLDFSKLASPVLGLFGERDSFVTPEVARACAQARVRWQVRGLPHLRRRRSRVRKRHACRRLPPGGRSRCLETNARLLARESRLSSRAASCSSLARARSARRCSGREWSGRPLRPAGSWPPGRARSSMSPRC